MIYIAANLSEEKFNLTQKVFKNFGFEVESFSEPVELKRGHIVSLDKNWTNKLLEEKIEFFNWDLLFSNLGPNDVDDQIEEKLRERVKILKELLSLKSPVRGEEFHGSIRVHDLAKSAKFYRWLFGTYPKEWTHRYVTFVRKDTGFNFVLLVSDGKDLHHDTLYHLGMGVGSKEQVVEFYHSAVENGFEIHNPPRTTWKGTPLHELWLKDPDGTLIEVYARLNAEELSQMPEDKEPVFLV